VTIKHERQQLLDAWTAEKERRMLSDAGLIINDKTGFVDEFMANPLCESVVRGLEVVRVPAINPASGITEIKLNCVTLKTYRKLGKMKKPLKQYLAENYATKKHPNGCLSAMADDWSMPANSISQMLTAVKPVHVYGDDGGRLTIESELRVKK
jgi:hypothetical protein